MNIVVFSTNTSGRAHQLADTALTALGAVGAAVKTVHLAMPAKANPTFFRNAITENTPESIIIDADEHTTGTNLSLLFKALHETFPLSLPYVYLSIASEPFFKLYAGELPKAAFHTVGNQSVAFDTAEITIKPTASKPVASLQYVIGKSKQTGKTLKSLIRKKTDAKPPPGKAPLSEETDPDPKLWRFLKIEFRHRHYFHHIELKDIDQPVGHAHEAFVSKVIDPLMFSAISGVFFDSSAAEAFNTSFLPVQIAATPGIFDLCQQTLKRQQISELCVLSAARNQFYCPDLSEVLGINPDISVFRFFSDTATISLEKADVEAVMQCRRFPAVEGTEEETARLALKRNSLTHRLKRLGKTTQKNMFSKELLAQETDILIKAKNSLGILEAIYGQLRRIPPAAETPDAKLPVDTLLIAYDRSTLNDMIVRFDRKTPFTWLNMAEFENWEDLSVWNAESYRVFLKARVLSDTETIRRMRSDINRLSADIKTAQADLDRRLAGGTDIDPVSEESSLKKEITQCHIQLFASCLSRFLTVNAERIIREKKQFVINSRLQTLRNTKKPGVILSHSETACEHIGSAIEALLPNFGGSSPIHKKVDGALLSAAKQAEDPKSWFKELIQMKLKRLGDAMALRYLVIHDDINLVRFFLDVLQKRLNAFLPVIVLAEGTLTQQDIDYFRYNGYPLLYCGCYTFENAVAFDEKMKLAFNSYITMSM